jgi:hypothetical protein
MPFTATPQTRNNAWRAIYSAAPFALLAALFAPHSLSGLSIFDEGFIVSGAMLLKDGMLPYRDFFSMYGPGQYYLTAAIFFLLGENLLFVRLLHIALLAALGTAIYSLARQVTNNPGRSLFLLPVYAAIVLFAKPNAGYPAITATLFLLLSAFVSGGVKFVRIGRFEIHNRSLPVGGVIQASIWSFMR